VVLGAASCAPVAGVPASATDDEQAEPIPIVPAITIAAA